MAVLAAMMCISGCGSPESYGQDEPIENKKAAAVTEMPKETVKSGVTITPGLTEIPESTAAQELTITPELTAAQEVTVTPESAPVPELPKEAEIPEISQEQENVVIQEGTLKKPDHPENADGDKLIFIGDSRTEGIRDAVDDNSIWSCLSSMGYEWMSSVGVPQIEDEIDEYTSVIILMGVNDVYQINNYVNYINKKANEWADLGARTYYVSVGPVENDLYVTNAQIESFNDSMEANLAGVTYIDVYSHLVSEGFYTLDGIHYPESVSVEIYDYILEHLEETRSGIWG